MKRKPAWILLVWQGRARQQREILVRRGNIAQDTLLLFRCRHHRGMATNPPLPATAATQERSTRPHGADMKSILANGDGLLPAGGVDIALHLLLLHWSCATLGHVQQQHVEILWIV
jgi:hypothetical protein